MFCWLAFAVQLFSHFHCHLSLGQGAIHLRVTAVDLQLLLPLKIWKSRLSKSGSLVSKAHNSSGCHLHSVIFFLNCGHTFEFDRTSRQSELSINPQKMKLIVQINCSYKNQFPNHKKAHANWISLENVKVDGNHSSVHCPFPSVFGWTMFWGRPLRLG